VRRRLVDFLDHADDLAQLIHEIGPILEPPRGVDDQQIHTPFLGFDQGVIGETRRIGARRPRHYRAPHALAPEFQLADAGGAERIARGKHHRRAGVRVKLGELTDGRRLAGAVDAANQQNVRFLGGIDLEGTGDGFKDTGDILGQGLAYLHRGHFAPEPGFREVRAEPRRRLDAEIGRDQKLLDLLDGVVVEAPAGDDRRNPLAQPRRRTAEAGTQPRQPPFSFAAHATIRASRVVCARRIASAATISPGTASRSKVTRE
jgi:hypothetical protein